MSESKFKCPFCGNSLIAMNDVTKGTCIPCGLTVDVDKAEAWFTHTAPEHFRESFRFLELFEEVDPMFVLSQVDLFQEGFKLDKCLFFGNKLNNAECKTLVKGKMLRNTSLHAMLPIAGKRMLMQTILPYFKYGLSIGANVNPLYLTEPVPAKKHMWLMVLLNSVEPEYTTDVEDVTNLYFDMTLEAQLQRLLKPFRNVEVQEVTPEQALVSYVLNNPEINIAWGAGTYNLHNKIIAYIKACLNDIDTIQLNNLPTCDCKLDVNPNDSFIKEIYEMFLRSMPSTCVNWSEDEFSKFDILNHIVQNDPFAGYKQTDLQGASIIDIYNTYLVLSALVAKYMGFSSELGIEPKAAVLFDLFRDPVDLDLTDDQVVVTFWKHMSKYVAKELRD